MTGSSISLMDTSPHLISSRRCLGSSSLSTGLPPISLDLFDVKQYQGEPLKDFLNRFGALVVKLHTKDEAMMVHAFRRGMLLGPFSDSLIKCHSKTISEIRRRAVAYIDIEEEVIEKRGSGGPTRLKRIYLFKKEHIHFQKDNKRYLNR